MISVRILSFAAPTVLVVGQLAAAPSVPRRPVATAPAALTAPSGTAPMIREGQCLHLLGAPAGAPLARTEARSAGEDIVPPCIIDDAGAAANRDGENMAQAWSKHVGDRVFTVRSPSGCETLAWVGHEFGVVGARRILPGWVDVAGSYRGLLTSRETAIESSHGAFRATVVIAFEVLELDPVGGETLLARSEVLRKECTAFAEFFVADAFSRSFPVAFRGGSTHRIRMVLDIEQQGHLAGADFGSPGSGYHARYDSIEVCVNPDHGSDDDD